jgi:hypothetical protein
MFTKQQNNYMKTIILMCALCLFMTNAFTQSATPLKSLVIKVPDFADAPAIRSVLQIINGRCP